VAFAQLGIARLDPLALPGLILERPDPPARVRNRERDRIGGIDLENRRQIA